MRIKINDGRGQRAESLGGVAVLTSGGVPPLWAALTQHLPGEGRVLDYGSWQGLAALWLKAASSHSPVSYAHYSAAALAQVRANAGASGLDLEVSAMFPPAGLWDTIVLAAPEQNEALHMLAGQAAACLAPGGQVLAPDRRPRLDVLAQHFDRITEAAAGEGWSVLRCTGPRPDSQMLWRTIHADIVGIALELDTLPGNFSPEGLDAGTRAMLELATIPEGGRVLDLACGYGGVGIAAARLGAGEVVYVDEDLIALTACRHNLERLNLAGTLIHSHLPGAVPGSFDCILTNPPYHTDYGVASSFLEFAARRLNPGGRIYVVVKKADWYIQKMRTVFGGCRVEEREGYSILSAEQRPKAGKQTAPKTTRKHQRRQQAARERNRRE